MYSSKTGQVPSHAVLATELVDSSGSIQDLLFPGIERMALGANFNMKFLAKSRTGIKGVPAAADYLNILIIRVNFWFHFSISAEFRARFKGAWIVFEYAGSCKIKALYRCLMPVNLYKYQLEIKFRHYRGMIRGSFQSPGAGIDVAGFT